MQSRGREDWNWEPLGYNMHLYSTVSKSTTIPGRKILDACQSFSLCLHSVREHADDDVSCLREQGAQRYADRQVGKTFKTLGPSVLIGRTFLGPTPSTEYINTDKYI